MKIILVLTLIAAVILAGAMFETQASAQYQQRSGQFQGTRTPVNGTTYANANYGVQVAIPDGWSGIETKRDSGPTTVSLAPGGFQPMQGGQRPPVMISLSMMSKNIAQGNNFMQRRMMTQEGETCTNSTSAKTVNSLNFNEVVTQCTGNISLKSKSDTTQTDSAYITLTLRINSDSDLESQSAVFDTMLGTLKIANASSTTPPSNGTVIPSWVKKNASYWSTGAVGDSDFVLGMQYLVQHGVMKIPASTSESNSSSSQIPSWIKTNAGWWASGQISDDDFVKGIQYLISNGIMKVS